MEKAIRRILKESEEPLTYEYPIGIDETKYDDIIRKVEALGNEQKDRLNANQLMQKMQQLENENEILKGQVKALVKHNWELQEEINKFQNKPPGFLILHPNFLFDAPCRE